MDNKIEIKEYIEYKEEEILKLYNDAGWTSYTDNSEILKKGYNNSLKVIGAYLNEELVGIIRCVGDGFTIVLIQDLIVLERYQRLGIGKMLMDKTINEYKDVYQIELMTDVIEKNITFYKSVGLTEISKIGCTGFMRIKR